MSLIFVVCCLVLKVALVNTGVVRSEGGSFQETAGAGMVEEGGSGVVKRAVYVRSVSWTRRDQNRINATVARGGYEEHEKLCKVQRQVQGKPGEDINLVVAVCYTEANTAANISLRLGYWSRPVECQQEWLTVPALGHRVAAGCNLREEGSDGTWRRIANIRTEIIRNTTEKIECEGNQTSDEDIVCVQETINITFPPGHAHHSESVFNQPLKSTCSCYRR